MPRAGDAQLLERLTDLLGASGVARGEASRRAFARDAMPGESGRPAWVLSPSSPDQIAPLLKLLKQAGIPYVPRGAGTGLSGGAAAADPEAVINLARLRKIHHIDPLRRLAVVEPGVVNAALSQAASRWGLEFAPDPSSEPVCTIGGNIAENASGPHTLKYGVTRDHLLALEMAHPDGRTAVYPDCASTLEELLPFPPVEIPGPDLISLMTGSEGTLGIVTRAMVLLKPVPEQTATLSGYFRSLESAVDSVTRLLDSGFLPAAVEMIDDVVLKMVARNFSIPMPAEANSFLLVEVDGIAESVAVEAAGVEKIFRASGALDIRRAQTPAERDQVWLARKKTFGALGRVSPDYYVHDGVVPRSRLNDVLKGIRRLADEYRLPVANIFHAGDGNLHPTVLLDTENPDEAGRSEALGAEILRLCLEAGGTLTGEHGVGLEKRGMMEEMFTPPQMDVLRGLRDLFNPDKLCNPRKIFPSEAGAPPAPRPIDPSEGARRGKLRPAGARDVEQILNEARRYGLQVRPRGAGTIPSPGDSGGGAHAQSGSELDLTGLDEIERIAPADLAVEAQCGTTPARLNAALAEHGLWIPLDAPDPDRSTIGGIIAAGYTGRHGGRWGHPRRRVLALETCMPGQGLQLWGRPVPKNVAGYDVVHLMVGSRGTLGVLTKMVLRAEALPALRRSALLRAPRPAITAAAAALLRSHLPWSHLDLVIRTGGGGVAAEPEAALLVGCEGSAETHERLSRELQALAGGEAALEWDATSALDESLGLCNAASGRAGGSAAWRRYSVDPPHGPAACLSLARALRGSGALLQLHLQTGLLTVMPGPAGLVGRLPAPRGWTACRHPSEDGERQREWRRLRELFDPAGTLNPGRLPAIRKVVEP
jgi:D-lactate dehydrogenase (cytochrome)